MITPSLLSRLTLRQVLGVSYFLGISLLALVILLLAGGQLRAQWREDLLNGSRQVAERLAQDSRFALIQRAAKNVQGAVEMARSFPNVEAVAIFASDGTLLVGSVPAGFIPTQQQASDFAEKGTHLFREDGQRLVIAAPVIVETFPPYAGPFEAPGAAVGPAAISFQHQLLGSVVLTVSKAAMHSAIGALERQLLFGIIGLAAVVFFVILLVMTWVTRPFRQLAQVMTDPRTPQQYTQTPVYGLREAREMASSFNALIASFAAVQGELVSLNEALESRVRERTRALSEADAAKSRFLSKMSHEIRTPLHGVITSADLLLTTTEVSREQRPYVQTIHDSACLLLNVIDSVLDWSKIEAGKVTLETADFDLHSVIQRVTMILSLQAEAKGLWLHTDLDPAVPYLLQGDPTRLSQILMNLAGNAVKFTERGEVRLKVSTVAESEAETVLRFEVLDTGIGIPAAAQARIFDYFAQVDESTVRRYGGTGLGTAIAKFLVELMGGRIGVQSELGKGSRFWFEVPFGKQPQGVFDALRGAQHRQMTGQLSRLDRPPVRPLRILVAEDNPTNQFVIRQLLLAAGHLPRLVGDGRRALQALETEAFDLALIDMHMPGLDGLEVVVRYCRRHPGNHCTIVMLTADATPTAAAAAYAAGVTAHLTKPVSVSGLLAVIDRLAVQQPSGRPPTLERKPSTAADPPSAVGNLPVLRLERLEQIRRKVRSPAMVAKLIETYLGDAESGLEKIERGLANRAWEDIRAAAHVLRGASAAIGAEQVMALCEQLEQTGDFQEHAVRQAASSLKAAVAAVTDAVNGVLRKLGL